MLTKKLNEPLDRVVGVPDRQDLVVCRHVRSRPPDYRGRELIAVVLVRLANADGQVGLANRVFAVRFGKVLALGNRVGHPEPIVHSIKGESRLDAALGIAEGLAWCKDLQFKARDVDELERATQLDRLSQRNAIVKPVVATVPINPERASSILQAGEVSPTQRPSLYPIQLRVKQPVFLLVVLRSRFNQRHLNDVQAPRVTPVLILALVLGDLLRLPIANRTNPGTYNTSVQFPAGDAPPLHLPGVSQTYDPPGNAHL